MHEDVTIIALVIGFVLIQIVHFFRQRGQATMTGALMSKLCEQMDSSRRSEHRDNLAVNRTIERLIEKLTTTSTERTDRLHAQERSAEERHQAVLAEQEIKSRFQQAVAPKPAADAEYEVGRPAESMIEAQQ